MLLPHTAMGTGTGSAGNVTADDDSSTPLRRRAPVLPNAASAGMAARGGGARCCHRQLIAMAALLLSASLGPPLPLIATAPLPASAPSASAAACDHNTISRILVQGPLSSRSGPRAALKLSVAPR